MSIEEVIKNHYCCKDDNSFVSSLANALHEANIGDLTEVLKVYNDMVSGDITENHERVIWKAVCIVTERFNKQGEK